MTKKELLINQLIGYLHHELQIFDQNFISSILDKYLHRPDLVNHFQQRIQHIKNILQEKKDHEEIIKQIQQQIHDIDQNEHSEKENILQKYQQYKEDFHRIYERECSEIQPLLGTRLELAIRTLDADLQLTKQILEGKKLADLTPTTFRITRKISQQSFQSLESDSRNHMILIRNNLSKLQAQIQVHPNTTNEQKTSDDLLRRDIVNELKFDVCFYLVGVFRMIDFRQLKKNIRNRY